MSRPHPWPAWDPSYDRTWDLLDAWLHIKFLSNCPPLRHYGYDWFPRVGLRRDAEFREFALLCFDSLKETNPDFRAIVRDMTVEQMREVMQGYEERVRRTVLPLIDTKLARRVPEGLGSSAYFLCHDCQAQACEATSAYLGEDWPRETWAELRDDRKFGVTATSPRMWTHTRHDDALRHLAGRYGYLSFCGKSLMFEPEKGLAVYLANLVRKEDESKIKRRMPLLALYVAFLN